MNITIIQTRDGLQRLWSGGEFNSPHDHWENLDTRYEWHELTPEIESALRTWLQGESMHSGEIVVLDHYRSFRPEVLIQGNWKASDRRFATYSEAKSAAQDLYTRQILCEGFRAEPCDDPITHAWVGDSKRTPARTKHHTLENPCTQCGGDGWEEEPSHFAQGRCDGDIIYRQVECDHCHGTGEEPTPVCECGDDATETYKGEPRCAECAEAEKEDAA